MSASSSSSSSSALSSSSLAMEVVTLLEQEDYASAEWLVQFLLPQSASVTATTALTAPTASTTTKAKSTTTASSSSSVKTASSASSASACHLAARAYQGLGEYRRAIHYYMRALDDYQRHVEVRHSPASRRLGAPYASLVALPAHHTPPNPSMTFFDGTPVELACHIGIVECHVGIEDIDLAVSHLEFIPLQSLPLKWLLYLASYYQRAARTVEACTCYEYAVMRNPMCAHAMIQLMQLREPKTVRPANDPALRTSTLVHAGDLVVPADRRRLLPYYEAIAWKSFLPVGPITMTRTMAGYAIAASHAIVQAGLSISSISSGSKSNSASNSSNSNSNSNDSNENGTENAHMVRSFQILLSSPTNLLLCLFEIHAQIRARSFCTAYGLCAYLCTLFPASPHLLTLRAECEMSSNDWKHALRSYTQLHLLDPFALRGMDTLAWLLHRHDEITQLHNLAVDVLRVDERRPETWVVAALDTDMSGFKQRSVSMLNKALLIGPRHFMCHLARAHLLLTAYNMPRMAHTAIHQAIACAPLTFRHVALYEEVLIMLHDHKFKDAALLVKESFDQEADNPMLQLLAARVLRLNGSTVARAEKLLRRTIAMQPDFHEAVETLCQLLVDTQRVDEAFELAAHFVSQYEEPDMMVLLGQLYEAKNEPENALACFKACLACSPEHAFAQQGIARLNQNLEASSVDAANAAPAANAAAASPAAATAASGVNIAATTQSSAT